MSRIGLPSFKLLIAGAIGAAAVAYYMGEFPDKAATGARTTQPAVVKAVRPDKPLSPKRTAAPASPPAKSAIQPRPTKTVGPLAPAKSISAPRSAKALPSPNAAKAVVPPRSPVALTGSIVRAPRPPETLPGPRRKQP
jgi:hypothetical protein